MTNKLKRKVGVDLWMKPKNNMVVFADKYFGWKKTILYADLYYVVTNLKCVGNLVTFELWDEEGFIGMYKFNGDLSCLIISED